MRWFASLRGKLTLLIAAGSVMTAVIAAAGFSWWDLNRSREYTTVEISAVADIVADQVGAAMVLGDRKGAAELLSSLRTDDRIHEAVLYSQTGACFAAFRRVSTSQCAPRPPGEFQKTAGSLAVTRPVRAGEERVGDLVMEAKLPTMTAILRQYLKGAALITALSFAVAALLAVFLQSRVSAPILKIARVAQRTAQLHQFEERVPVVSSDEVGILARSFNSMLDEIVRRDAELAQQRRQLEQEVAERSRVNGELLLAKEKAEEATRLKSEFLANMSHEIRTPLNGVGGMILLALDKCVDGAQREQLCTAQRAAESLTMILNDILDLSKIEAGKMTLETIDFDVRTTVRDCLQLFELKVREKNLRLDLSVEPGCPGWVEGDPVRLRQVLINLVGNAVKFTSIGGVEVTIGAPREGLLRFEIADTGIGIASHELTSIFEAFIQADASQTRRFGGTGLGLTISRRLVDLMGGHLWVDSAVGKGSRFSFELPLKSRPETQHRTEPVAAPLPELPALHVLVAEDNIVNQKVVCGLLRRQGWTTVVAATGAEAYACFLKERFDLILMDIQMPELNGHEAATLIRRGERDRGLRRTPIVALTAHASQAEHDQCLKDGMDGVVTKPVNLPALLHTMAAALGGVPQDARMESALVG